MKLTLSDNIRLFRKQRKMTQERLAEVLGVTAGAVYKWESGMCLPEVNLIVEMADFFDTSVDVLLGYQMKDNRLDMTLERQSGYCRTLDPGALGEAEKALAKYPHSFQVVYTCAIVYLAFGAGSREQGYLSRALELLEQSKALISQNDDPRISEATICGDMATVLFLLNRRERCIDLLKRNNAGGHFSGQIGAYLAIFMNRTEDAVPFLSEALFESVSAFLTTIAGYVFVFRAKRDWDSAAAIVSLGIEFLDGVKTKDQIGALDKAHAEMLVLLAYAQLKSGMRKEAEESLKKAWFFAKRFDSAPDYSLRTMRFVNQTDPAAVFDVFGAEASGSIMELIRLLDDRDLAGQWKEISSYE